MVYKDTKSLNVDLRQHTLSNKYDAYYEREVSHAMGTFNRGSNTICGGGGGQGSFCINFLLFPQV